MSCFQTLSDIINPYILALEVNAKIFTVPFFLTTALNEFHPEF
jgi:hypothetical protein